MLGDTAGAIQDLTDAIRMGLDSADSYIHRRGTYNCVDDMPAALADLNQPVAKETWNPQALTWRVLIYDQMGNYKKALANFDAANAIASLDALDQLDRQICADVASGKVNTTDVATENVDFMHAKRMLKMQDYAGAVPALERALRSRGDHAQVLFWLGFCKWKLKQYNQACADLDKALDLVPDYAMCLELRAEVKFDMEDFGGAFADACAAQPHAAQVLPAALWVHCAEALTREQCIAAESDVDTCLSIKHTDTMIIFRCICFLETLLPAGFVSRTAFWRHCMKAKMHQHCQSLQGRDSHA